jgi:hypothetical protein
MDMTIEEFCDKFAACESGRDWAMKNCSSMRDAWEKLRPDWLQWVALCPHVLTGEELQRFMCDCVRAVYEHLQDEETQRLFEVVECYADGQSTVQDLKRHKNAARRLLDQEGDDFAVVDWSFEAATRWATRAARETIRAFYPDISGAQSLQGRAENVAYAAWNAFANAQLAAQPEKQRDLNYATGRPYRIQECERQVAWLRANTKPNFERKRD